MSDAPTQPSVLFVKLSAIGDIVMASGLPANIKSTFDDSRITWLVESPYQKFVAAHPHIDDVIPWPKAEWSALAKNKQWVTLFNAVRSFRRELRQRNFTVAIDAQGLLKSALLCWLSGAKRRIGFKSKEHSEWLLTESIAKPQSDDICSEYKALGRYLGANRYQMNLPAPASAYAELNGKVEASLIHKPFIAICPFTTRPQKHWPHGHWQQLIKDFRATSAMPIVILGGPGDQEKAAELAAAIDDVIVVAGLLSLEASGALLSQAYAVIGVDTGLTHLAIAHDRTTLTLFCSTCPYRFTDNPNATVIYKALPCAPCKRRPICDGAYTCMSNIQPDDVLKWLERLL